MQTTARCATAVILATITLLAGFSPAGATGPELNTEEDKTLYALGLVIGGSLSPFALTEQELELVKAGLTDAILNREQKIELRTYGPKIREMQNARSAVAAAAEKKAGQTFLDTAAAAEGATRTDSGLIITTLKVGTGESPKATDRVKVHYEGTLMDGTVFDSSIRRGEPATFALDGVIRCWSEGVQLMKVGGKSRLVCPSDLAYGDRGAPPRIKPGATLVFEVELLEIVK